MAGIIYSFVYQYKDLACLYRKYFSTKGQKFSTF